MDIKTVFLSLISLLFMSLACSRTEHIIIKDQPDTDPYYTSAFPVVDVSSKLEEIQESIIRISSTGRYRVYQIDEEMQITAEELEEVELSSIASRENMIEESTAGTATVIGKNQNSAYLITCAHTVEFADRVVKYRIGENIPANTYVESVAIKQDQVNIAITPFGLVYYSLVDEDRDKDLALIELDLDDFNDENLKPLNIYFGASENLRTGSFIYVLGFPRGYKVATRGIVSQANRNRNADFITDALFNRGISGGIILASKNNFASFEWVGIASAGVATHNYFLVPEVNSIDYNEQFQQYTGPVMAQDVSTLNYGLTHSISTRSISEFLSRNRSVLRRLNSNLNAALEDF